MAEVLLRHISASDNMNREYKMTQLNPRQFEAAWRRYGGSWRKKVYSMSSWDRLYEEKLAKGYIDVTQDHIDCGSPAAGISNIFPPETAGFVSDLISFADQAVAALQPMYASSLLEVTDEVVYKGLCALNGMRDIQAMAKKADPKDASRNMQLLDAFNDDLNRLLTVIPVKTDDLRGLLASDVSDMEDIIDEQNDRLQTISSGVTARSLASSRKAADFGFEVRRGTDKEIEEVKKHLRSSEYRFRDFYRVTNKKTREKYDRWRENHKGSRQRFLYHGTGSQNVLSICQNGLTLNPKHVVITGKMFGYGIYFAKSAAKSLGYVSSSNARWNRHALPKAYLLVYKVATKNQLDAYSYKPSYGCITHDTARKDGFDTLYAHKDRPGNSGHFLYDDEIIIYDDDQCDLYGVIEVSA